MNSRQKLSKNVFLCVSATLLINTSTTHAITWGSFREKVRSLAHTATSQVRGHLSSAYQSVKGFDKTIIIDRLLASISKLGSQVGDIKDCMLFGFKCSPQKRAAFYATAITILALTAAVVGLTITIAATAKEPDKELQDSVTQTSHEVSGWSPEAVFQRLSNTINSFKERLLSLKTCLIKRKCTKSQKRMLYASAATITALVTITIGIGIGSYIYAEKRKKEEVAALPGISVPKPTEEKVTEKPKEEARPSFEFDETPEKEVKLSRFQQFFKSKVQLIHEKGETLKTAYNDIKDKVKKGIIKTKEAAAEKFVQAIEKMKDFSEIVKETLTADLTALQNTFNTAKKGLKTLKEAVASTIAFGRGSFRRQMDGLTNYIEELTDNVARVKELSTTAIAKAKITSLEKLQQSLASKKANFEKNQISLKTLYAQGKEKDAKNLQKQIQKIAENITTKSLQIEIKPFIRTENLQSIYPTLVGKINNLELYQIGNVSHKVLGGLAALLGAAATIHKGAGTLGLVISQENIQQGLRELQYGIKTLGGHLQKALSNQPLIVSGAITTKEFLEALIKAAQTDAFAFVRQNIKRIESIVAQLQSLDETVEPLIASIEQFTQTMNELEINTKNSFIGTLKKNPIRGIPHAAGILHNALGTSIETAKIMFNDVMKKSLVLLIKIRDIAPNIFTVLKEFNIYMSKVLNKPFINEQFINDLIPILTIDVPNLSEAAKKLSGDVEALP